MNVTKKLVAIIAALTLAAGTGSADDLPAPEGDVVLTVTGHIHEKNVEDSAAFDMAMLEALPSVEVTTETIWTEGPQTFVGVELKELVEMLEATSDSFRATAINDYAISIPREDAIEGGAVVAYKQNGEYMSRRDKGPLWVIYPYDDNIDYRSETIYSRSIWQLDRIEAE